MLRLHLRLEPGMLASVLDRISTLGVSTRTLIFRKEEDGSGALFLELNAMEQSDGDYLVRQLRQMPAIRSVVVQDW